MKNVIAGIFLFFCLSSYAQEVNTVAEGQALFIYNFIKLVAWPDDQKTANFTIGVLGSNVTYKAIEEYTREKRIDGGRDIVVKRYQKTADVDKSCQLLMITSTYTKEIETIYHTAKDRNILLIAEKDGAIEKGAAINFLLIDGKIKFEVKTSNITDCHLKYASQLESLAYKKH